MDDLKILSPFLFAIKQVAQDAAAFPEDDKGLNQHFKILLKREITKSTVCSLNNLPKSPILQFPTNAANLRPQTAANNKKVNGSFATPIRSLHTCPLQPHELIHGWYGRMRAINVLPENARMAQIIAETASQHDPSLTTSNADAVHHVASLLGLTYDAVSEHHTLVPFFSAIQGLRCRTPNGKSKPHRRAYDQWSPLRLEGEHPRFCKQCTEEDVENFGFSYWRREHQLPGMLCCTQHGAQLSLARHRSAFAFCPHQITDTLTNEKTQQITPEQLKIIRRYAHLASEVLNQAPAIDSRAASAQLGEWARAQNFRVTRVGKRPTVSSLIFRVMPHWWLTENFPRIRWSGNNWLQTVDGACSPGAGNYSASTLCLLAAVLCDNPEEAGKILWPRPPLKTKLLGADFWASKAVLNLYIEKEGVVNGIGEKLDLPNGSAAIGLAKQGLPGLGNTSSVAIKAIQAFLNGENCLEVISGQYNVPIDELENLLRQGCARLKYALNTIAKQADTTVFTQQQKSTKKRFRGAA